MQEYVDLELQFDFAGHRLTSKKRSRSDYYSSTTGLLKSTNSNRSMGLTIATARIDLRMTQKELALRMHVKVAIIQRWESSAEVPSPSQLQKLQTVLQLSEKICQVVM